MLQVVTNPGLHVGFRRGLPQCGTFIKMYAQQCVMTEIAYHRVRKALRRSSLHKRSPAIAPCPLLADERTPWLGPGSPYPSAPADSEGGDERELAVICRARPLQTITPICAAALWVDNKLQSVMVPSLAYGNSLLRWLQVNSPVHGNGELRYEILMIMQATAPPLGSE